MGHVGPTVSGTTLPEPWNPTALRRIVGLACGLSSRKALSQPQVDHLPQRARIHRLAYKLQEEDRQTVGRNTAIMELKLLAMIMGEAVPLGHADANPLVSLKLRRDKSAKKPEMTDDEITRIRKGLKTEPEWMQISFGIGLNTGCRLRETRIPIECLDFREDKITFPAPKGGEDRAFSIPMPTALRPLLARIRKSKRKFTLDFPFQPSRRWQQFFIKMGMPHLCFHCLRVTYVNRLRRVGVPREVAMRLVNHSSALVHQIYQREKVDDVAPWRDAVQFPGIGVGHPEASSRKHKPRKRRRDDDHS